jgi:protein-L-isoaspartate(D-aspartate) O-methyltransferase
MVRRDLAGRGVRDARVLAAVGRVPRERFVPAPRAAEAYADHPLDIGLGQTISQPYIAALMTEMLGLTGSERVLEIGTGSGYQTAVLAALAAEVYSVERLPELSERARAALAELGCGNVRFRVGDGTLGWPEEAPFDAVLVAAAAPHVPGSLRAQLADGGRLVMPVGPPGAQRLVTVRRGGQRFTEEPGIDCIFVRLIGKEGHQP